jgi:hypothetical protein
MSIKALFALVSVLAVTSGNAALAQHVDPSPYSQHPEYRSAPVDRDYGGNPESVGASDGPRALDDQEQPRYPLSPPNGAE